MEAKDWLLIFTTGAAVVGPLLTTAMANRHAASLAKDAERALLRREQRDAQRHLSADKRQVYQEALSVLSKPRLAGASDFQSTSHSLPRSGLFGTEYLLALENEMHDVVGRLTLIAPAPVGKLCEGLLFKASLIYMQMNLQAQSGETYEAKEDMMEYSRLYNQLVELLQTDVNGTGTPLKAQEAP